MSIRKTLEDKLNEGRQYRNIDISSFERRVSEGSDEKVVSGYATTFNQVYELLRTKIGNTIFIVREQVDADAFAETDLSDVIMQYDHEGRVFARTSNGTLQVEPDEHGLHIRANLGGTELGRQLYDEIDGGYTTKMSFGFRVGDDKREETEETNEDGQRTVDILRTITKISNLYDVSAVSLPANDATSISARSWADGEIAKFVEEFRKREEIRARIRIKGKANL